MASATRTIFKFGHIFASGFSFASRILASTAERKILPKLDTVVNANRLMAASLDVRGRPMNPHPWSLMSDMFKDLSREMMFAMTFVSVKVVICSVYCRYDCQAAQYLNSTRCSQESSSYAKMNTNTPDTDNTCAICNASRSGQKYKIGVYFGESRSHKMESYKHICKVFIVCLFFQSFLCFWFCLFACLLLASITFFVFFVFVLFLFFLFSFSRDGGGGWVGKTSTTTTKQTFEKSKD